MKTGSDVVRKGIYASECCLVETGLAKDQSFPRCPKCLHLTMWMSVRVPATGTDDKDRLQSRKSRNFLRAA
jgi:hypothetical protein